jgi:hypothetical protein
MADQHMDDPVKKLFGKTANEIIAEARTSERQNHDKAHSSSAFCGSAGPEELKHVSFLLSDLTDNEMLELTKRVGIHIAARADEREILENVLTEADREVFYCEYHRIINGRSNSGQK